VRAFAADGAPVGLPIPGIQNPHHRHHPYHPPEVTPAC
jgi:hypothetical protein